ncbi:cytochrome P450 [Aspergillus vadensis CBS 113365]|uniref:Cytochrome P450 n=1 Tax=Aspergillus vadensis (strain CBS 113365 / IMI 142717 / IBT 24658) TaxID=1448311 RepID=A0A319B1S2_ASPVC|nr:cytochrome P450 [Aspergillus vadensis CBS 113365]PYH65784.1 cytochrome P450 [Aspergillus vadensis CBS 113365]
MDGPGNQNTRSDWYDLLFPRISSIFTRDRALHNTRRRIWTRATSSTAIRQYQHRIIQKVHKLKCLILAQQHQPILVNELMYWFAFDSMGDFAFSMNFGMMENQEWHRCILLFRSALALLGPFSPAIWIPRLAFTIVPGLWWAKWWFQMLAFCDQCMEQRMCRTIQDKDIASFFIEDHFTSVDQRREQWLSGDTATLVVAGKDAVGLSKLSHLNGVINETLRLLPAVPTFGTRVTPPEGLTIAGTFIPGGTKICAPRYTIGRLESAYERPNEFIPERWYCQEELVRDRRAFAPFGVGNTSCVGKNLALTQIRLVVASLVMQYRISFAAASPNGEQVERDLKDQLTANPGPCWLEFSPRN